MRMKITPLVTLIIGEPSQSKLVLPGQSIDIDDVEGSRLIEAGVAIRATDSDCAIDTDDEQLGAIIDAIAELPTTAYGKDGKPNVKSLMSIVEFDITASQRDEAWQQFQLLSQA